MKRQFVNLVLDSCKNYTYTMHRIRSSSLFHQKKHKGRPLPPTPLVEAELPKPVCSLSLSTPKEYCGNVMFMPFGCSREQIMSADDDGNVLVHDLCQNSLSSMPRLQGRPPNSIAITLGDAVYVIKMCPNEASLFRYPWSQPCFQALIHGEPPDDVIDFPGWFWHTLPLPPYTEAPEYMPSDASRIVSSTVLRDSIWVSARGGIGTYSFNTTSRTWSKLGGWELPFRGAGEYVPELGLWLGLSTGRENQFVCASDLSAVAPAANGAAPTLCHVWKEDLAANPENWEQMRADLVRVDSGRFCIARLFHVYDKYPYLKENFVVFTGVELTPSGTADGGIQMVKHKSIRYNFDRQLIHLIC